MSLENTTKFVLNITKASAFKIRVYVVWKYSVFGTASLFQKSEHV